MSVPQVLILTVVLICLILAIVFRNRVVAFWFKAKDSFSDFLMSLKYGNFTEREETVCNIYLNYHYPVYSPYNSNCYACGKQVTSQDSPRCPVCGIYICMNCGECHPNCTDRDGKIVIAEKETLAILSGKKKMAMQNRIEAVKPRANDKLYYCELLEKGNK
ncbi:MAG: hypothetical protein IJZ88_07045 [Clostridia bacterium]|nr:hypothetical protein [Clostridia bacterium]